MAQKLEELPETEDLDVQDFKGEPICGYCNNRLDPGTAYKSPGGYLYCTAEHFYYFTED